MLSIQYTVLILSLASISVEALYSFSNCGPATDKIKLTGLVITPHPMKAPGSSNFTLDVEIAEDLLEPIEVSFDIKATALIFTQTIPCENGVGSCTYPDWCVFCPTCDCPITTGKKRMLIPMNLTSNIPIGSKATVKADITFKYKSNRIGCVRITNVEVQKN